MFFYILYNLIKRYEDIKSIYNLKILLYGLICYTIFFIFVNSELDGYMIKKYSWVILIIDIIISISAFKKSLIKEEKRSHLSEKQEEQIIEENNIVITKINDNDDYETTTDIVTSE